MKIRRLIPFLILLCAQTYCLSGFAQERYEQEYPDIPYGSGPKSNSVSKLFAEIEAENLALAYHPVRGYLDSVLEALNIDPSSQVLVFSKSSLKRRFITPETPRALYFNDEVYVGWVQGSRSLEIAAMDSELGPVFLDLPQIEDDIPQPEFETNRCLRCHDTYGLTGGGVPRFMLSTVLAGEDGDIVSHEINFITDTSIPLYDRFGGWYVTGTHGEQRHLGNLIIRDSASFQERVENRNGNRTDLTGLVDVSPYKEPGSDIVALLVIEHQVEVQNRMTRASWEVRTAKSSGQLTDELLAEVGEPLLRSLLMLDEAMLEDAVEGVSGYAEYFQSIGPFDSEGNSLRELDLQSRIFKYPLSYLVYSDAFKALPEEIHHYLFTRMGDIFTGREDVPELDLVKRDGKEGERGNSIRIELINILKETLPELSPYL